MNARKMSFSLLLDKTAAQVCGGVDKSIVFRRRENSNIILALLLCICHRLRCLFSRIDDFHRPSHAFFVTFAKFPLRNPHVQRHECGGFRRVDQNCPTNNISTMVGSLERTQRSFRRRTLFIERQSSISSSILCCGDRQRLLQDRSVIPSGYRSFFFRSSHSTSGYFQQATILFYDRLLNFKSPSDHANVIECAVVRLIE